MNQTQHNMEQLAALTMIAYAVGLLVGEALRDELHGPPPPDGEPRDRTALTPAQRKWRRYSGLFILLRHQLTLDAAQLAQLVSQVLLAFGCLVRPPI